MFVVRTSKPVESLRKMGYFDRVKVSLHILFTANQALRVCLGRPSGDVSCASEDIACGY